MAGLPARPQPSVLTWPGSFQLQQGCFTIDGFEPLYGQRLWHLFHPESLGPGRDPWSPREAALRLDKSFLTAQLRFHCIPIWSSMTESELRLLLETAVANQLCDSLPHSVLGTKERMQREYQPLLKAWQVVASAWDAKQDQYEAFGRCETPGQQAKLDINLFLEHYFLTNGRPDPSKTPEPLALRGCVKKNAVFLMVKRIPTLSWAFSGYGTRMTLYIGWDPVALSALAVNVSKEFDREQLNRLREAMTEHLEYLA